MSSFQNKRVTIQDIAREAGVSHPTVSRALHGSHLVSDATKKRIQKLADKMSYTSDPMLSALMSYRKNTAPRTTSAQIALVVGSFLNSRWKDFSSSAREQSHRLGYDYEHYNWDSKISDVRHSQILKSRGIKGIILGPITNEFDLEKPNLSWEDFTVVTVARSPDLPQFNSVSENQFNAVRLALEKIPEAGYKCPGLIVPNRINIRTADRLRSSFEGYMAALPANQRTEPLMIGDIERLDSADIRAWIKKNKIDCIVGHAHICARIEKFGIKVPEEIPFIALDLQSSSKDKKYAGATHDDCEIARLAITMLSDHIMTGTYGIPESAKAVLLNVYWSGGQSFPYNTIKET